MLIKREQEVQKLLQIERASKKQNEEPIPAKQDKVPTSVQQNQVPTSPKPKPEVSEPTQNPTAQSKPSVVAPQANTIIAQAIEPVIRSNKLEEEQSSYRKKLAAKGKVTEGMLAKQDCFYIS